jgi:hypothetical protein
VTFYDYCNDERFWTWQYTKHLLKKPVPAKGKPYYRVGYCPAYLDDVDGFVKLGTLLPPGYRKTPEYGSLMASSLPQDQKDKLADAATKEDMRAFLLETDDFSALKWFHENAVPQVIQTHRSIYQALPKRDLNISLVIRK